MAREEKTIAIAGAGSIGCYVGGCLALAGRKVVLLARPRIEAALRKDGLRVSDLDCRDHRLAPKHFPSPPIRGSPCAAPTSSW